LCVIAPAGIIKFLKKKKDEEEEEENLAIG
jgi:hypothetical protein